MSASALKRHATSDSSLSQSKAAKIDANDEPLMFEGKAASKVRVLRLSVQTHANLLSPFKAACKI